MRCVGATPFIGIGQFNLAFFSMALKTQQLG